VFVIEHSSKFLLEVGDLEGNYLILKLVYSKLETCKKCARIAKTSLKKNLNNKNYFKNTFYKNERIR
jgi:hypothetical protein